MTVLQRRHVQVRCGGSIVEFQPTSIARGRVRSQPPGHRAGADSIHSPALRPREIRAWNVCRRPSGVDTTTCPDFRDRAGKKGCAADVDASDLSMRVASCSNRRVRSVPQETVGVARIASCHSSGRRVGSVWVLPLHGLRPPAWLNTGTPPLRRVGCKSECRRRISPCPRRLEVDHSDSHWHRSTQVNAHRDRGRPSYEHRPRVGTDSVLLRRLRLSDDLVQIVA